MEQSHMSKYLLADSLCPKLVFSKEVQRLDDEIDSLEEKLSVYRGKYGKPLNEEMRHLCFNVIAPLCEKRRELFEADNKEYFQYWGVK